MTLGIEGKPTVNRFSEFPDSLKLQLADVMRGNERQVYSFMTLLSDFGGFNDGIVIFPAILMTFYNS